VETTKENLDEPSEPSLTQSIAASASRVISRGGLVALRRLPEQQRRAVVYLVLASATRLVQNTRIKSHQASFDPLLVTGTPRSAEALYYGRGLHIKRSISVLEEADGTIGARDWDGELLFSFPSNEGDGASGGLVADAEHEFRVWLERDVVPNIDSLALESREKGNFIHALAHEYFHHRILKATSVAAVLEGVTWRKRLREMYLMEQIHARTGIPRLLDAETVPRMRRNFEGFSQLLSTRVAGDQELVSTFDDIVRHHYFSSRFYPAAVEVLVEPVTWAILESSWTQGPNLPIKLAEYFGSEGSSSYEDAARVLTLSTSYSGKLRGEGIPEQAIVRRLLKSANKALDPPARELLGRSNSVTDLQLLQDLFVTRFEEILNGEVVDGYSDSADKRFSTALAYAVRSSADVRGYHVDKELLEFFAAVLGEEKELMSVAGLIVDMMTGWGLKSSDDWLTVLANAKVGETSAKFRYDPMTGLTARGDVKSLIDRVRIGRTGGYLNRLDDLVGDLPPTLSTCLSLLYYLDRWENPIFQAKILDFGRENLQWIDADAYQVYKDVIVELLRLKEESGLSYLKLLNDCEQNFGLFLTFWITFVTWMGEFAKYLRFEHGMWE
jgi:hypothetical protein